jgi:L-ascorbate metabolism protein UlaG (beta-lactamase superfamily)
MILSGAVLSGVALYLVFSYSGHARSRVPDMTVLEMAERKFHHRGDGTFFNPWCATCERSFVDFLKWRISGNPYGDEKKKTARFPVERPDMKALEAGAGDYAVWLGHSTVLMRAGNRRVMTDPVFSDINFLLRRKTPFPIEPGGLPSIGFVLISHSHYDHMNTRSLRLLKDLHDPVFVTGPGYGEYFSSVIKTGRHVSLDWTESYSDGGFRITALPAQHWSKRGLSDTNRLLWASFLVEADGRKYFWAGDTGYFSGFKEMGERFGPVDAAFLPIGSYEPRWFMKENHLSPEEALAAAKDLGARVLVPIHWGTFDLTDEPLDLPARRLREAADRDAGGNPAVVILRHGGHIAF